MKKPKQKEETCSNNKIAVPIAIQKYTKHLVPNHKAETQDQKMTMEEGWIILFFYSFYALP